MIRSSAVVILLASALAHAQPSLTPSSEAPPPPAAPVPAVDDGPRHYVRLDFMLGGVAASGITAMLGASVGIRLGRGPWWLHGEVAYGGGTDLDSGGGPVTQVRAGLEHASCSDDRVVCLRLGADLGYQHDDYTAFDDPDPPDREWVEALVVVPYIRADLGGDTARFGVAFELDEALAGARHSTYPPTDATAHGLIGAHVIAGLAIQW